MLLTMALWLCISHISHYATLNIRISVLYIVIHGVLWFNNGHWFFQHACIFIHDLSSKWWVGIDWLMMTSSNGSIFRVTGPLWGEFTGPGEFPTQRPVTRSFDVFFDLGLNRRLSKQPRGWWFETQSWSLWRHCNVTHGNVVIQSLFPHHWPFVKGITGHRWILLHKGPVIRTFDVSLNKLLSGRWFETTWSSCDVTVTRVERHYNTAQ